MQYADTPVDIDFEGPIAMLAKRYLQMQGFNATVPQVLSIVKEVPELNTMLDNLDPDEVYAYIMTTGGAPARLSRDIKVVQQIRQNRNKEAQEQQKMAKMEQLAGAYQKGGKAAEPGSAAQQLMEQQQ
jgi:hypothetical protein